MPVHLRGYAVQQTTPPALDVLGAGSFGIVVKAHRNSNGETVALKIMACMAFDGPNESVVAARKEKATLDAIGHHPHITQLKGWEEIDPTDPEVELSGPLMQGIKAWMVAEHENDPGRPMPTALYARTHTFCIVALQIAGEKEVYELLLEKKRFSAELLRPVMKQLADALWHVHSRGFCHFDVKAENIRITCPPGEDPKVTLVDFGLAVNLGSGDRPTQKGTEGIAAPEFFTGAFTDVDTKKIGAADIFSLGVVVFTLAFGYPPWAKATADGSIDDYGRGFLKYARLSEPGRLLAYVEQTPVFNMHLSPPALPALPATPAPPAPTPMATGPTQPYESEAPQAPPPAVGALVPPVTVPAPSDPRLIDLLSEMLQIHPAQRPTAQEILEHDWITTPAPTPVPVPAPPAPSLYASCNAGSDAAIEYTNCNASDAEPQFTGCGATAPASAAYRSLGDPAPPDTELVLPKLTRTHAIVKEGWAFAE